MNPLSVVAVWSFGEEVCYVDLSYEPCVGSCSVKFWCRGVLYWLIVLELCWLSQFNVLVQRCAMVIYWINPIWIVAVWSFGAEVCYGDLSYEHSVGCCSVKFWYRGVLWWFIVWTLGLFLQYKVLMQGYAMVIYRVSPLSVVAVWRFGLEVCYVDLSCDPSVSCCSLKVWCRGMLWWFIVWILCHFLQCEVLV